MLRRLSAAALDQALKPPGASLLQANTPTVWTRLLRDDHALRRRRFLCESAAVRLREQARDPQPTHRWDWSRGFVIARWENICPSAQTDGGRRLHVTRRQHVGVKRRHVSRGPPVGRVVFTPDWGLSSCSTMQIRASSTAAATAKKSEERATDSSTGDELNLKEPSAAEKAPVEPEPEGGKPSKTQQLKKVFKEYGAVGVSFHIGISLMSLGMFYLLLSSGMDMAAVLCKLGFSESVVQSKMAAGTSTFVLAYAIHKLFAPVRVSITLVSVPLIVRYCRKTGLFKPPTPAP